MVDSKAADPADDPGDLGGQVAGRDGRAEPDERMARRVALAVERPSLADGELQLDHRLQPVDVGSLQETGLDQSHGPRRIPPAARDRLRLEPKRPRR